VPAYQPPGGSTFLSEETNHHYFSFNTIHQTNDQADEIKFGVGKIKRYII
jgi:hypothetical protein